MGREAHATSVTGRVTVGGYGSTETFNDTTSGSTRNDFMTGSGRLYLRVSDYGKNKNWEFTSDLRDKHDFFDKLDRERLSLTDKNALQVRQLSGVYQDDSKSTEIMVGRFPIFDAGSVHCDGALVGWKPVSRWSLSSFAGLNARRPDQQYVSSNPDSFTYGGLVGYQSRGDSRDSSLFASAALVEQQIGGQTDRRYLYTTSHRQWGRSHVLHLLYLDFVPRTYVQSGYFGWNQDVSPKFSFNLNGIAVDVIEYSRRQGVRERLESSPYKEGTFEVTHRSSERFSTALAISHGERSADRLDKNEMRVKWQMPRLISPKWDASMGLVYRDNFTSHDVLARGGVGYFTRRWEISANLEGGQEKHDSGETLNPLAVDVSFARYHSRSLFWTLTAERIQDQRVVINGAFFRLSYRFGNEEVPPVRDGAVPRGRL